MLRKQMLLAHEEEKSTTPDTILISFGTVVFGNLLSQNPTIRPHLIALLSRLVTVIRKLAKKYNIEKLHIVIPKIFKEIQTDVEKSLPNDDDVDDIDHKDPKHGNTQVIIPTTLQIIWSDEIDQIKMLGSGRVQLFINHGGCNSVRESAIARVPMMVIPWFGDQYEAGQRVADLKWGTVCSYDPEKDSKVYDQRLNTMRSQWERYCLRDENAIYDMLRSTLDNLSTLYLPALSRINQDKSARIKEMDKNIWVERHCHLPWKDGDLLFGANSDRISFAQAYPHIPFHVGDMRHFNSWCLMNTKKKKKKYQEEKERRDQDCGRKHYQRPCLIDHYHDVMMMNADLHKELGNQNQESTSPHHDATLDDYLKWLHEPSHKHDRMFPLGRLPMRCELDENSNRDSKSSSEMCPYPEPNKALQTM
jgi:hypothetical protein